MRRHRWPLLPGFLLINMPKQGNPQLENGYTKIANELLEGILLADLNKEELKITMAIIRQTYGWGKKEAAISISTFELLTGIDRRHIARSLKTLLEREMISRVAGAKMKYGKPVYKYWLNKKSYCQYGNSTIANTATEAIANRAGIKEKKEIFKERRKMLVEKFAVK